MDKNYKTDIHNAINQIDKGMFNQTPLNQPKALDQIARNLGDAINKTGWFRCAAESPETGHKYKIYANKEKFGESADVGCFELESRNGVPTLKMCLGAGGNCASTSQTGTGSYMKESREPASGTSPQTGSPTPRPGFNTNDTPSGDGFNQIKPQGSPQGMRGAQPGGSNFENVQDFQIEQLQKNVHPLVSCLEEYFVKECDRLER